MEDLYKDAKVRCILALICCALWGSAFPCVKIGYGWFHIKGAASQVLFAGYRFFTAGIFTFLLSCVLEKRVIVIKRSSIPYVLGQGFLQTTVQYVCFYIGLAHTTGAKGSVINASSAFFTVLVAHFLLRSERITWKKAWGCLIGFAGVIVINLAPGAWGSGFSFLGEGLLLLSAFAYGTSSVTLKMISGRESPAAITAYQLLSGGAALVSIGLAAGGSVHGFTVKPTLLFLYMALLSTIAFTIWAELIKYNPVSTIAIFGFSIPVFGVALSALFLHENVWTVQDLAALILVSTGIWIVDR